MTYVDKRVECVSTETAYLTEGVLARPNLKVVIHAQVTKIIFEKNDLEPPQSAWSLPPPRKVVDTVVVQGRKW